MAANKDYIEKQEDTIEKYINAKYEINYDLEGDRYFIIWNPILKFNSIVLFSFRRGIDNIRKKYSNKVIPFLRYHRYYAEFHLNYLEGGLFASQCYTEIFLLVKDVYELSDTPHAIRMITPKEFYSNVARIRKGLYYGTSQRREELRSILHSFCEPGRKRLHGEICIRNPDECDTEPPSDDEDEVVSPLEEKRREFFAETRGDEKLEELLKKQ